MDRRDEENKFLLDAIRNELVSIIENRNENSVAEMECETNKLHCDAASSSCYTNQSSDRRSRSFDGNPGLRTHDELLESHCCSTIDEDLQKMYIHLKESYELFQSIGERFNNINFNCLKSRIKELHLSEKNNDTIKTVIRDLNNSFDQKYMDNRLSDLTKDVRSKFRKYPGEFGDIPELSEFFRACTQLQHGMEALRMQRLDVQDLTTRMNQVAQMSFDRVNEMQNMIKKEGSTAAMEEIDE